MSKSIVFCADGTWDDPNSNSNVTRLYLALAKMPSQQLTCYDSGVGAESKPMKLFLVARSGQGCSEKSKTVTRVQPWRLHRSKSSWHGARFLVLFSFSTAALLRSRTEMSIPSHLTA